MNGIILVRWVDAARAWVMHINTCPICKGATDGLKG